MVAMQFFVFLFIVLCESKEDLVPQAISELVKSRHGQNLGKIDLFYDTDHSNILGQTVKLLSDEVGIKVTKFSFSGLKYKYDQHRQHKTVTFDNDVIFIFESVENYSIFTSFTSLWTPNEQKQINVYFYCEGFTKREIPIAEPEGTVYKNYLIEENGKISLHAITMFTEHRCKVPQLVEINRFIHSKKIGRQRSLLTIELNIFTVASW